MTKQRILDKALEMFNENGVEYVGLRELAGVLEMRVSNITYYFPTKDDLVFALASALTEANQQAIADSSTLTLDEFFTSLQHAYANQVRYRGIVLSVVHLLRQNKHLADSYLKSQQKRNADLTANIQALVANGFLAIDDKQLVEQLVFMISLISRFWISEAFVSHKKLSFEKHAAKALYSVATLLSPYCTAPGKKSIAAFFKS